MFDWLRWLLSGQPKAALERIERTLEALMGQVDDLKAAQAEILEALAGVATSTGNIATDVDTLIALVQQPQPDLTEVLATANQIKERAVAARDALAAIDAKYPSA